MVIKKVNIIALVIGFVLALLFFNKCDNSSNEGQVVTETHIDTSYRYVTRIDTLNFKVYDTIYTYIDLVKPFYDTIRDLNIYELKYDDSLISAKTSLSLHQIRSQ